MVEKPETKQQNEKGNPPKNEDIGARIDQAQENFEKQKKSLEDSRELHEEVKNGNIDLKNAQDGLLEMNYLPGKILANGSLKVVSKSDYEKSENRIAENENLFKKNLSEKHLTEVEGVIRASSEKIDSKAKKSAYQRILKKNLNIDDFPQDLIKKATENIPNFDKLSTEVEKRNAILESKIIQNKLSKLSDKMYQNEENKKAEEDINEQGLTNLIINELGISDFDDRADEKKNIILSKIKILKDPSKVLENIIKSVQEKGIIQSGIDPKSELGKKISGEIEKNIGLYMTSIKPQEGVTDIENFKGLQSVLGGNYADLYYADHKDLFSKDNPMLTSARDALIEITTDTAAEEELENDTPEGKIKYQKNIAAKISKSTGLNGEESIKTITKMTAENGNISPIVKFLADILGPFGAMFEGEVGDFWREYLKTNEPNKSESAKYGEGRTSPAEGRGIEGASANAIYEAASSFLGRNEQNSPELIRQMHQSAGLNAGSGTPWCMSFVQHVLRSKMGFSDAQIGPKTASAKAGHNIGAHTDNPKKGDIVLIYRSGGSGRHIGFFDSMNADGSVNVLGGNQSDSVKISKYSKDKIAEFRTLESTPTLAQSNGGESGNEGGQNTLPENKGTVDKLISYLESLKLMTDPSTPKYDEKGRLIIYKVHANGYKRDPEMQSTYNTNIARGDKDKHFIAVHGTAADYGVSGGLTDEKLDQSGFNTMLNTGLYPYFVSKKGIVFSTTENDANHPACINDKANTITGYDRLNNKGLAIEMSLRADGHGSVEKPNEKQMQSGRDLILALRGKYNIGAGNVITSKDPVRDPFTGEFKGEHSDDFDDSVRTTMGIARYTDTARRFREKTFFTDTLAKNPPKQTLSAQVDNGGPPKVTEASVYDSGDDGGGEKMKKNALNTNLHYSDDPNIATSCAADWSLYPPGTIMRINGKKYIVDDYGSYIMKPGLRTRIDRYQPNYTNTLQSSQYLLKNPEVVIEKIGDFSLAQEILKTRNPSKNQHIAMMLSSINSRFKLG